jgi:hypothetical protein
MAGGLKVDKAKVSGTGTVGAGPDPLAALKWRANSHPAVQAVDAKLSALMQQHAAAQDAFDKERATLDAQRDEALKVAMREMVG